MTRVPWLLVRRHLGAHWFRSGLTTAAMALAVFLFCFLVSVVTTLDRIVAESASNRLIVQSAVSLFVALPTDYQPKIEAVPGVESVSKFQWFGGFYQDQGNFFAQFAVDPERFLEQYRRDLEIVPGPGRAATPEAVLAALQADRRAAVVGTGLVRDFGWDAGDTVPLQSGIFPRLDGTPWEFNVVGVYRPLKSNLDDRTLFFRFDYLEEALRGGLAAGPRGVGTYSVNVAPGADPAAVTADIDALFANGPQRTRTTTEAAFQAAFASMMGNLPMFLGSIGGAVVFAVFFSLVNTMLMAARQRIHESGVLKALGFPDRSLAALMLGESLLLAVAGGLLGTLAAVAIATPFRRLVGTMLPNFAVEPRTVAWALGVALAIGLVSGLAPAFQILRLRPTEALRSEG